jgi:hypothetical protein
MLHCSNAPFGNSFEPIPVIFSAIQRERIQMLIGVPKEIKNHEYRVGMTPMSVREAVRQQRVEPGVERGVRQRDACQRRPPWPAACSR